jgi:hypothetical protein
MGIYAIDLRELVIRPVLESLNDWSQAAENLLLGTAAHESAIGFRLQQTETDTLGLYRISPQAHLQLWDQFLVGDPELASRVRGFASQQQFLKAPHHELITNLSYASAVAWMIYKSRNVQLPHEENIYGLAHTWFNHYAQRDPTKDLLINNSPQDIERFATNYRKFVLRENKKIAA